MKIFSTYSVKIKHFNHIFNETISLYRQAVDFFISVCLSEWDNISSLRGSKQKYNYIESVTVRTKKNPDVKYDFSNSFYKFPSYLRRSAIAEALGKVSSYKSNLANWIENPVGKKPGLPKAGKVYPAMYRDNMFVRTGTYTASIKVFIRNTWDWLDVDLKKSDVDYILHHCKNRKECVPTLQKRGKEWFLDFAFEEEATLNKTEVQDQTILAVDLGINSACTCSVMQPDGTILSRKFLKLEREYDYLNHTFNRIKKAQQNGAIKCPRLWAKVKGITSDISSKTAQYIIDVASEFQCDVIVFEALNLSGKKRGRGKQKLQHWKAREVQSIVTNKVHRLGIRISHVNAWGTSKFAFDGSGLVLRGKGANIPTYSLCKFQSGKIYNCDLSASYNIGARYFIREFLKSLPETERLQAEAEVPRLSNRTTCTWIDLVKLNAVIHAEKRVNTEFSPYKPTSSPCTLKVQPT